MAAKTLLVIGGHVSYNWYELFDGAKLHDVTNVKVETAHWDGSFILNLTNIFLISCFGSLTLWHCFDGCRYTIGIIL
jgi:hypothetical protein